MNEQLNLHTIASGPQTYMLTKLGESLPEWMQYREIFWNSLEAILRNASSTGVFRVSALPNGKVRIIDTGAGMSREDMPRLLNTTFTSGTSEVGKGDNHGIGSKITVRVQNQFGVEYISLRDGVVTALRFILHPEFGYCIDGELQDGPDGARFADLSELDTEIVSAGHGTQITLYGRTAADRPAKSLPAAFDALSARLWERPAAFVGKTCRFEFADGTSAELYGALDRMYEFAESFGCVELVDQESCPVNAWWFIVPSGTPYGRTAGLLSGSEIYHPKHGQAAKTLLTDCGIHEGSHRVALFFEPSKASFPPNTERDALTPKMSRSKSIDTHIGRWSAAFKLALPGEIRTLIAEETSAASDGSADFDRSLFASRWSSLYRLPAFAASTPSAKRSPASSSSSSLSGPTPSPRSEPVASRSTLPSVGWRAASVYGSDLYGSRPAVYDSSVHTIWLDPEHARFTSVTGFFTGLYASVASADIVIDRVVKARFAAVAVDAFRSVAAEVSTVKQAESGFAACISAALGMLSTAVMPSVEAELKASFR
jgi:hypothetical protein